MIIICRGCEIEYHTKEENENHLCPRCDKAEKKEFKEFLKWWRDEGCQQNLTDESKTVAEFGPKK